MSCLQIVQMSNYCGIGIDAELSLDFHQAREEEPGKFTSRCWKIRDGGVGLLQTAGPPPGDRASWGFTSSNWWMGLELGTVLGGAGLHPHGRRAPPRRFHNKGVYVRVGLQKMSRARGLHKEVRLQVEQQEVELPSIEGLIFINIPRYQRVGLRGALASHGPCGPGPACPLTRVPLPRCSWGSGADLWGSDSDSRFEKPRMDDGLLEVVGVTGVMHMVSAGRRGGPRRGTAAR